jgi:hypothetical protein
MIGPVAWKYDCGTWSVTRLDRIPESENGYDKETPLYSQETVLELVNALEPFVRSLVSLTGEDFPPHIGNDEVSSAYDLTREEVDEARRVYALYADEKAKA